MKKTFLFVFLLFLILLSSGCSKGFRYNLHKCDKYIGPSIGANQDAWKQQMHCLLDIEHKREADLEKSKNPLIQTCNAQGYYVGCIYNISIKNRDIELCYALTSSEFPSCIIQNAILQNNATFCKLETLKELSGFEDFSQICNELVNFCQQNRSHIECQEKYYSETVPSWDLSFVRGGNESILV